MIFTAGLTVIILLGVWVTVGFIVIIRNDLRLRSLGTTMFQYDCSIQKNGWFQYEVVLRRRVYLGSNGQYQYLEIDRQTCLTGRGAGRYLVRRARKDSRTGNYTLDWPGRTC